MTIPELREFAATMKKFSELLPVQEREMGFGWSSFPDGASTPFLKDYREYQKSQQITQLGSGGPDLYCERASSNLGGGYRKVCAVWYTTPKDMLDWLEKNTSEEEFPKTKEALRKLPSESFLFVASYIW